MLPVGDLAYLHLTAYHQVHPVKVHHALGLQDLFSICLVKPCLSAEPFSGTPLTQFSVQFLWEPAVCSPKETLLLVSHTCTAWFKFLFLASLVQWLQGSELARSWGPYKVCWLSLVWWFSIFSTVRFLQGRIPGS